MTEFDAKFGFAAEPSREGESFTLVEWRRLRAAIDSLCASTWVKFATVDGEVVVDGRASPYKSHVRLALAPVGVEGTSCTVWAYNGKHELLIEPVHSVSYGPPEIGEGRLRMRWVTMRVPHRIVAPLIKEVRNYLPVENAWWNSPRERLAEVWLAAPIVAGWEYNEELGKMVPVFAQLQASAEPAPAQEEPEIEAA